MLADCVVAPVPFVITTAEDPKLLVTLSILNAAPAVAPTTLYSTIVDELTIAEFVTVKVCDAPPAIDGEVNVTAPIRPLHITAPLAAPDVTVGVVTNPEPAANKLRFPADALNPVPAVTVDVAAILPGAINVDGIDNVTTPAELEAVIWFAVPFTAYIFGDNALATCTQLDTSVPPEDD